MICCSRCPTRLICSSMNCTSPAGARKAARALGSTQGSARTLKFLVLSHLEHPCGQIYEFA